MKPCSRSSYSPLTRFSITNKSVVVSQGAHRLAIGISNRLSSIFNIDTNKVHGRIDNGDINNGNAIGNNYSYNVHANVNGLLRIGIQCNINSV